MNNQQTNSKRLVRKTGLTETEAAQRSIDRVLHQVLEAANHSTRVVIQAFNSIRAPRLAGRERYINFNGRQSQQVSDRGGETYAR